MEMEQAGMDVLGKEGASKGTRGKVGKLNGAWQVATVCLQE